MGSASLGYNGPKVGLVEVCITREAPRNSFRLGTSLSGSKMKKRLLSVTVETQKPPPRPEKKLEQQSFLFYFIGRHQAEL